MVRLGGLSPVGTEDVDDKRQGGVITIPLYDAQEVALLEVVQETPSTGDERSGDLLKRGGDARACTWKVPAPP
ncbi:hypothetical protein PL81_37265 [Streptomyces sp. RSD-27]|nr:hypothetical protein PL81_37265 [Streptomyces sp. RSD-27]